MSGEMFVVICLSMALGAALAGGLIVEVLTYRARRRLETMDAQLRARLDAYSKARQS